MFEYTFTAVPLDTDAGVEDVHPNFFLKLPNQIIQSWALELDDLTAIQTCEMMVFGCADWFIMLALVVTSQVASLNESHFRQNGQSSVHGSQTDIGVLLTRSLKDAFCIEVFFRSFDYIQHDLALESYAATTSSYSGKGFSMIGHRISLSLVLLQIILNNFGSSNPTKQVKYVIDEM